MFNQQSQLSPSSFTIINLAKYRLWIFIPIRVGTCAYWPYIGVRKCTRCIVLWGGAMKGVERCFSCRKIVFLQCSVQLWPGKLSLLRGVVSRKNAIKNVVERHFLEEIWTKSSCRDKKEKLHPVFTEFSLSSHVMGMLKSVQRFRNFIHCSY